MQSSTLHVEKMTGLRQPPTYETADVQELTITFPDATHLGMVRHRPRTFIV
jgi:hypothetical protein